MSNRLTSFPYTIIGTDFGTQQHIQIVVLYMYRCAHICTVSDRCESIRLHVLCAAALMWKTIFHHSSRLNAK